MSRSEVCKNCCPNGGALFRMDFGCFQHVTTKEWMVEPAWVKVCQNCGHYKLKRKRAPRLTRDQIKALTSAESLKTKRDLCIFHLYSEHGAVRQMRKAMDDYCDEARRRGVNKVPILCLSYYNDYHPDGLRKAFERRSTRLFEIRHHVNRMMEHTARVRERYGEDFE